jgi:integrase
LKLTQYRGMGVETIAPLLGHAKLRTVMRYVHLSQEHLDRSMVLYGVEQPKRFGDSSPVSVSESKVQ